MLHINKHGIQGVYHCGDIYIVVSEIVTQKDEGGNLSELSDPYICYRDLNQKHKDETITMMPLSEFKQKYKPMKF